ncbi:MAG: 6-phosphofructokinase [Epulopiscium sp.]|nr:6-phosphofructokinase [Candidatus Epulonipiscium sp.]
MKNTNGNCLIGQSGGPTVAINATLCGVLNRAMETNAYDTIYGMVNGIEGLLQDKIINLSEIFGSQAEREKLQTTPAMYLGSCRFKLPSPEECPDTYAKIFDIFKEHNITSFFYIGGNDSMDTVLKLSNYAKEHGHSVQVMGIPKTIDNDLPITDHTPGYGSAAKYVATSLLEIAHDTYIYNMPSVTIVEIMGRNAGWLTAAAALARNEYNSSPDLIYLPEVKLCRETFIKDVKELQKKRENIIIAVSEGVKGVDGDYLSASGDAVDSFGHKALSGAATVLEDWIKADIGCKTRSVILNVLQRSAAYICSATDIKESLMIGSAAVDAVKDGITGKMVCYKRISNDPYKVEIITADVDGIANAEKMIPKEWITDDQSDVTQNFIDYARPLIEGEMKIPFKNGLPQYCDIKHLQ